MATIADALGIARTLLNDDAALQWHDQALMPKAILAHQELVSKLLLNGIPALYEFTAPEALTIPASSTAQSLVTLDVQPANMQNPIRLFEWTPNDDVANAIPMTKVDFLPNLDADSTIRYWAWIQQQIWVMACTVERQISIRYLGNVPVPTVTTDELFFNLSETFIGPRVAALCDAANYMRFDGIAQDNLSKLVRIEVKRSQNLPVRRRPFSYSLKRRGRLGAAL